MKTDLIVQLNKTFEGSAYTHNGVEYWMARDLQKLLDYNEWRNFFKVIDKAKLACLNSGHNTSDHFVDVNKTIPMPKGAEKNNLRGEQAITGEHIKNNEGKKIAQSVKKIKQDNS